VKGLRILIDIGHPAHVHFYRNFIRMAESRGHDVQVTARDKEMTLALLRAYGIPYANRGPISPTLAGKALALVGTDYRLFRIARKFRPDLLTGIHNPYVAHVAWLMGKPAVIFTDTEKVSLAGRLTFPFASAICTPACFREKIDPRKHVLFNGYKELAYLHPAHFRPDPAVLDKNGLSRDEAFILVRFIGWGASHDVGLSGISRVEEAGFLEALEGYGRVFLTSERGLGKGMEKYRLRSSPEDVHSLLAFARLYIGEGGTMTTEAAILGTPAIHIEQGPDGRPTGESSGNFLELRDRYGLLFFYASQENALQKAREILRDPGSKMAWQEKRERLLAEKVDVATWMADFILRFPANMKVLGVDHVR
jgi:predicted glycosyltransferase